MSVCRRAERRPRDLFRTLFPMPSRKEPVPLRFPPSPDLVPLWQAAVDFVLTLPGAEESRSYGTPALKVKGKLIARLRSEAEGGLAVRCAMDARDVLLNADPEAFYLTDHYVDYPMILVRLDKIEDDALRDVLEQAWRDVAPAKLVDSWDD